MDEPARLSEERLIGLIESLRHDVAYPATPPIAAAVTARLSARRPAAGRPPLAGLALWSRRRVVLLVAVGTLAALGLAAAARLAIGSIQVRVEPGAVPAPSSSPVNPSELGRAVMLEDAQREAGFVVALPEGPPPDEVYVVEDLSGDPGIVVAWKPGGPYPTIGGTTWSMLLMVFQGDDEAVLKSVGRFEDVREVSVAGQRAFWLGRPHDIIFETDEGARGPYRVLGNTLIWETSEGLTYRLETALGRAEAIALAEGL